MSLKAIYRKVFDGGRPSDSEIQYLLDLPGDRLGELLEYAHGLRIERFGNTEGRAPLANDTGSAR